MKRKESLLFVLVFVAGLAIYAGYDFFKKQQLNDQLTLEYPSLKLGDSIDSEISFIYCPQDVRCGGSIVTFVQVDDSRKFSILAGRDVSGKYSVGEVLRLGSHLMLSAGSDTLKISNDNYATRVEFVLRIGKSPDS